MLLILLLALALRLLLWSQPLHQPANDEVEYITVARDLVAGRGWQFYEHYRWLRAPLYPLFLAGSLWLAGGDASASSGQALHRAALPNLALSVVNVYLIYRLSVALVGRRAARLAALLAAMLLTFATFASLYMSETLFTFFFTAALVCLVRPPTIKDSHNCDNRKAVQQRPVIGERWCATFGGVLFGMATLTRSITLLFIPVVALWLFLRHPTGDPPTTQGSIARRLLVSLLFVVCCLLTIAPWTARNDAAYGRPILVETGLSFNLWFFNQPHESRDEIYRALDGISNPAERSDYAMAKGLARLREDPTILLRNLWPNWVSLLNADTTEDRFLQESYSADVGLPLFAAALIFDDAIYVLIALAAIAGLLLPRLHRRQATFGFASPAYLIGAWCLYVVLTVLLTHAETRYRHFLLPVLIPYAAWALMPRRRDQENSGPAQVYSSSAAYLPVSWSLRPLLIGVLWAAMFGTALGSYPWGWVKQNLSRGWFAAAGDIAWLMGDLREALHAYERASVVQETPDGWLRRGDTARALGDLPYALRAYREATHLAPRYVAASVRLGDLLRELGDDTGARAAFKGDYAEPQIVVDWAWDNLRPFPRGDLDIGDGLDFGYITGVYPAERIEDTTARWTDGHAVVRLGITTPDNAEEGPAAFGLVQLRLAAPHPGGSDVPAEVCAADSCWDLRIAPAWRTYTLPFHVPDGESLEVEIHSQTFDAPGSRRLGVLIDAARIVLIHHDMMSVQIDADHEDMVRVLSRNVAT
jgi:4-amino-4-deoxy-L-arabinose transferase-like glycosyltransferase